MHYITTHSNNDPIVRLYPFHTYTEAKDRMALIHNRLADKGYHYQRTIEEGKVRVRTYTQTGENTVFVSYQHG